MLALPRTVSGLFLLGLLVLGENWVWESHRRVRTPEHLGNIVVYGRDIEKADDLARAIAVAFARGVDGMYALYKRALERDLLGTYSPLGFFDLKDLDDRLAIIVKKLSKEAAVYVRKDRFRDGQAPREAGRG